MGPYVPNRRRCAQLPRPWTLVIASRIHITVSRLPQIVTSSLAPLFRKFSACETSSICQQKPTCRSESDPPRRCGLRKREKARSPAQYNPIVCNRLGRSKRIAEAKPAMHEYSTVIGLDLGDRYSAFCLVSREGTVLEVGRVPATPDALQRKFGPMERLLLLNSRGLHEVCGGVW